MSVTDEEMAWAFAALISICPKHQPDSPVRFDPDCGDCGSRQETASLYLLSLIEDFAKELGL